MSDKLKALQEIQNRTGVGANTSTPSYEYDNEVERLREQKRREALMSPKVKRLREVQASDTANTQRMNALTENPTAMNPDRLSRGAEAYKNYVAENEQRLKELEAIKSGSTEPGSVTEARNVLANLNEGQQRVKNFSDKVGDNSAFNMLGRIANTSTGGKLYDMFADIEPTPIKEGMEVLRANDKVKSYDKAIKEGRGYEYMSDDEKTEYADRKLRELPEYEKAILDNYSKEISKASDETFGLLNPKMRANDSDVIGNLINGGRNNSTNEISNTNIGRWTRLLRQNGWSDEKIKEYTDYARRVQNAEDTKKIESNYAITPNDPQALGKSVRNSVTDAVYTPIRGITSLGSNIGKNSNALGYDSNDVFNRTSNVTNYAKNQVTENALNGKPVGQFIYGAGMSGLESAENMAISALIGNEIGATTEAGQFALKLASLLPFAADAYTTSYLDGKQRGLTDSEAEEVAIASGMIEAGTELVSLDHMYSMLQDSGVKVTKDIILDWLAQAGIEGSEEAVGDIANRIAEGFMLENGKSQYDAKVNAYINSGMSREEAVQNAEKDFWMEVLQDFGAGALSGAMIGGGASAINYARGNVQVNSIRDTFKEASNMEAKTEYDTQVKERAEMYSKNPARYLADTIDDTSEIGMKQKADAEAIADKYDKGGRISPQDMFALNQAREVAESNKNTDAQAKYMDYLKEVSTVPTEYRTANLPISYKEGLNRMQESAQNNDLQGISDAYQSLKNSTSKEARDNADVALDLVQTKYGLSSIEVEGLKTTPQDAYIKGLKGEVKGIMSHESARAYNMGEQKRLASNQTIHKDSLKGMSVENGNIVFNGKVVDLNTIKDGATNVALKGAMAQTTEASQKAYLEFINDGDNIATYDREFNRIYKAGLSGASYKSVSINAIENANEIYNVGVTDRNNQLMAEASARIVTPIKKKGTGTFTDSRIHKSSNFDTSFMRLIAEATGLNVVLTDKSTNNVQASFNPTKSTIRVTEDHASQILHEVGEFIDVYAPEEYEKIRSAVIDAVSEVSSIDFDKTLDAYHRVYQRINPEQTVLESSREMTNDALVSLLSTEKGQKALSKALTDKYGEEEAKTLGMKIKDFFKKIIDALKGMLDSTNLNSYQKGLLNSEVKNLEDILDKFMSGLEVATQNYQNTELSPIAINTDARHSVSGITEALGLDLYIQGHKMVIKDGNGKVYNKITESMVKDSPMGAIINASATNGFISESDSKKEVKFFKDFINQLLDTQDIDLVYAINSLEGFAPVEDGKYESLKKGKFASVTGNSDPQYSSTFDVTTICVKTQAIIDVMSDMMLKMGRGLTSEEIVKVVYKEVAQAGESVPCPVCYVFSRWVGLGGLLNTINDLQNKYDSMSDEDIRKELSDLDKEIKALEKTLDKKAKKNLENEFKLLDIKKFNDMALNKDTMTKKEKERYEKLNHYMDMLSQRTWFVDVRLNKNYRTQGKVPANVLFDINKGRVFADKYPLTWKFRTTKGSGMGKATLPYSEYHQGQAIRGMGSPSTIGKTLGDISKNPILFNNKKGNIERIQNGELTSAAKKLMTIAILKQKAQNWLNGQRLQSTSDFRFEYALDYLMFFLDEQSIGAFAQMYTKVAEAVPLLASTGAEVNCSIMALGDGYKTDANGNKYLVFSNVTGMNPEDAFALSKRYNNVQPILVGINDEHIILAMADDRITFIIPYHKSGSTEARYVALMEAVGEAVTSRDDYEAYQREVSYENPTADQLKARSLRMAILTQKTLTPEQIKDIKKFPMLQELYNRFKEDEYYKDVTLTKSQAETIMPAEFWDKTTTIDTADTNTEIFKAYCDMLGYYPRFSGYDNKGKKSGTDFTQYKGYWKLLPDRSMYNLDGTYHEQKSVNIANFNASLFNKEEAQSKVVQPMKNQDKSKISEISDKAIAKINQRNSLALDLEEKAKEHFGTTTRSEIAGYITTDGTMLNFSGSHWLEGESPEYIKKWESQNDIRQVDHEDIYEVFPEGTTGDTRLQFMKRGNIRVSPEAPGINLYMGTEPTEAQYKALRGFINDVMEDNFYIDFEDTKPHKVQYVGVSSTRIINDIKNFYETGVIPEGNADSLNQFRYSLGTELQSIIDSIFFKDVPEGLIDEDALDDAILDEFFTEEEKEEINNDESIEELKKASKPRVRHLISSMMGDEFNVKDGKTLGLTDDRLNYYMNAFASSNKDYAQAYITYMSPKEFLLLTAQSGTGTSILDIIKEQSKPLDLEHLSKERQPIFIDVDAKEKNVIGHEGRHRMYALQVAGITKVPVLVFNYNNKYSKQPKELLTVKPQFNIFNNVDTGKFNKSNEINLTNLVPLSRGNEEIIRKRFGTESDADVRYSLNTEFDDPTTGESVKFSLRVEDPPKKTMVGYKVFVVKNGKLYPPMVANPDGEDTPVGVWLNADVGKQAPDSKTGRKQVKAGGKGTQGGSGTLAFRPGWHLGEIPLATQFDRTNPENGVRELFPENFVWAECEIAADIDYQDEAMSYGYTQNGKFQHSLAGLPKVPVDGYYKYRTNPNPETVPWLITGAMKVNRLLGDEEVNKILEENGLPPKQRKGGNKTLADLGLSNIETTDTRFSVNVDSEGNTLTPEQADFFIDSKVRDEEGRLKVVYHGSHNTFNVFNGIGNSKFGNYKFGNKIVNYFTTDKDAAKTYSIDSKTWKEGKVYSGYVNIANPYVFKDENSEDYGYSRANALKNKELRKFEIDLFRSIYDDIENSKSLDEVNELLLPFNARVKEFGSGDRYELWEGGGNFAYDFENFVESANSIKELFYDSEHIEESVLGISEEYGDDDYYYSTDRVVNLVLAMNDNMHTSYDGVVIDNILDASSYSGGIGTDVITIESSNQFKNIDNENPTDSEDIRKSLGIDEINFDHDTSWSENASQILSEGITGTTHEVSKTKVDAIATKILKQTGSTMKHSKLADMLWQTFTYMTEKKTTDASDMMSIFESIARPIIESSSNIKDSDAYDMFVSNLGDYTFKLTDEQLKSVQEEFGSYNEFRKAIAPLKISKDATDTLADLWGRMTLSSGGLLDDVVYEADMPLALFDTINSLRPTIANDYNGNLDEVARELAMNITEEFLREESRQDLVDKMKTERDSYRKMVNEEFKRRLAEERQNMRWQIASDRYVNKTAIAEARAKNKHRLEEVKERNEALIQKRMINKNARDLMDRLTKPSDKKHIPSVLLESTYNFIASLDFVTPVIDSDENGFYTRVYNPETKGFEMIQAKTKEELMQKVEDVVYSGMGSRKQASWQSRLDALRKIYDKVANDPESLSTKGDNSMREIAELLDMELAEGLANLLDENENRVNVNTLNSEDLKTLNKMLKNILHAINNVDKALTMKESVSQMIDATLNEAASRNVKGKSLAIADKIKQTLEVEMMTPDTFFSLQGELGEKMSSSLVEGFAKKVNFIKDTSEYIDNLYKTHNVSKNELRKWMDDTVEIRSEFDGRTATFTIPQIMSLYELYKRESTRDHFFGGVKPSDITTTRFGIERRLAQTPLHLTYEDLMTMFSQLNDKQKAVADGIQSWMASYCTEKGNEVSMELYGYKKYEEKNYFPMKVDKSTVSTQSSEGHSNTSLNAIKNQGFTKSLKEKANNTLIAENIFDVFTNHITEMSAYYGYAPVVTDLNRWYNGKYKSYDEGTGFNTTISVKDAINKNIYRTDKEGDSYYEKLISDLNRLEKSGEANPFWNSLVGNYKGAAVSGNIRVVVQQPTAYARALNMVDAKYMLKAMPKALTSPKEMKRIKDICPLAWWKSQGYYEASLGKSVGSLVTGLDTPREQIIEKTMWLAGKADDITWSCLYNAIEMEQRDLHPETSGEEFTRLVNERFNSVINETQVVDATVMKSQWMRRTGGIAKLQTAFMTEPIKSYNMVMKAMFKDYNANGKNVAKWKNTRKALMVMLITDALTTIAQSLVDAIRYKGEDDDYIDKLLEYLKNNMLDNVNPLNRIPGLKDISDALISAIKGESTYGSSSGQTIEAMSINSITDTITTTNKLIKGEYNKTGYAAYMTYAKGFSNVSGIPVYNISRDFASFWNLVSDKDLVKNKPKASDKYQAIYVALDKKKSDENLENAIENAIEQGGTIKDVSSGIKNKYKADYVEAVTNGDDEADKIREKAIRGYMAIGLTRPEANAEVDSWTEVSVGYSNLDAILISGDGIASEIDYLLDNGKKKSNIAKHIMTAYEDTIRYNRSKGINSDLEKNVDTALRILDTSLEEELSK